MDAAAVQRLKAISAEYRKAVVKYRDRDHSHLLVVAIRNGATDNERSVLESELIGEYQRVGRFADAEALLRRRIQVEGSHPYPHIALALHFQYFDVDLSKALRYIAPAVKRACSSREFGYLALGVQARLAIKSERWKLLARSLASLTAYRHKTGHADVFPETDFLSRIPEGRVAPQVVAKYVRRVNYLRRIGYSTLTGRSTRTRARAARAR
jgi:hypothetical protein